MSSKLAEFKNQDSDRAKVEKWLESIGAPKDEADEVLELCAKDTDARRYYVMRFEDDKCKTQPNNS